MTNRYFGLIAGLIILGLSNFSVRAEDKGKAPVNFVFIIADDLGYMDTEAYNADTFYDTPNIKKLADQGMTFTQGYAACPVCSPSRSAVLTGKYPVWTGVTDYINQAGRNQPEQWKRDTAFLPSSYRDRLDHDEVTLAEALKNEGYATFFAGKWHLGPKGWWPEDQGFDVNKGGIERGGPYGGKKYFSPYGNERLEDGPEGEHLPDRLASEACKFIDDNKDGPFLAYLSFYSVHTPLIARKDLETKYKLKKAALGLEAEWGTEDKNKVRLVQEHAVYAAMVEAMDLAVGKVMDCIDELGLAENTMIVFTSDNGGLSTSEGHPTSNLPLRGGKGWMYEGGIREPYIIKWSGRISPGSTCDVPVTGTDFYPTFLDAAGLELMPDQHHDGESLMPLLEGEKSIGRESIFWHYPHYGNQGGFPSSAIRSGDWKLIESLEDHSIQLFNLKNDPAEQSDLSEKETERAEEMLSELHAWQKESGATFLTERDK